MNFSSRSVYTCNSADAADSIQALLNTWPLAFHAGYCRPETLWRAEVVRLNSISSYNRSKIEEGKRTSSYVDG